ncbi:hypothetical protein ACFWAP_03965 [Streptomyces goshikiensis]|uniref:hypothetical protein n=1 Tax=Streptomyces goshikiensis TaxID=1942 RepID=UPI003663F388
MAEPFGPEYLRPAQKDCPRCGCCTAPLCARGQHSLTGCAAHADEPHRETVGGCPCSAETTKRTAAWRLAQIRVTKLAREKPLLPPMERLLRALVEDPMAPDPHSLFVQLEALRLATRVHDLPAVTQLGRRYLTAREEPRVPTPVEVQSVDESTRTAQVLVGAWDEEKTVTVLLDQLISATCLKPAELPGKFLEAHANYQAESADDVVLTEITVAPAPESVLARVGGDGE